MPHSSVLTIASASKQLTLYDVDRAALTPWSLQNNRPLAALVSSSEVTLAARDRTLMCASSSKVAGHIASHPNPEM